ncbi:hypothetical protein FA15DRAFT_657535 [Coprinopsis marcescibilis]|uniref:Uncharacterized protein n=1 Tax=Coprinopsis marcescibilis TaxID=230819 RepID=A0A5C3KQ10_COPMA|nr:hypothetical protein FA15DRAFT_657535 [Coprinopsis marcescibilis]
MKVADICTSQDDFLIAIVPKDAKRELYPQGIVCLEQKSSQANLEVGLERTVSPVKAPKSDVSERIARMFKELEQEKVQVQHELGEMKVGFKEMRHELGEMEVGVKEMQHELGEMEVGVKEMQHELGEMDVEVNNMQHELGEMEVKVKAIQQESWEMEVELGSLMQQEPGEVKGELNDTGKSRENECVHTKKREAASLEALMKQERQRERESAEVKAQLAEHDAVLKGLRHQMQFLQNVVYILISNSAIY